MGQPAAVTPINFRGARALSVEDGIREDDCALGRVQIKIPRFRSKCGMNMGRPRRKANGQEWLCHFDARAATVVCRRIGICGR
jgi:hypothetical protein